MIDFTDSPVLGKYVGAKPHTPEVSAQRQAVASLIGRIENILGRGFITDETQEARLRELVNETCRAFDMAPLSEGLKRVLERSK